MNRINPNINNASGFNNSNLQTHGRHALSLAQGLQGRRGAEYLNGFVFNSGGGNVSFNSGTDNDGSYVPPFSVRGGKLSVEGLKDFNKAVRPANSNEHFENSVNELKLTQNADGTFSRKGFVGTYTRAENGGIIFSGGHHASNRNIRFQPQIYLNGQWYKLGANNSSSAGFGGSLSGAGFGGAFSGSSGVDQFSSRASISIDLSGISSGDFFSGENNSSTKNVDTSRTNIEASRTKKSVRKSPKINTQETSEVESTQRTTSPQPKRRVQPRIIEIDVHTRGEGNTGILISSEKAEIFKVGTDGYWHSTTPGEKSIGYEYIPRTHEKGGYLNQVTGPWKYADEEPSKPTTSKKTSPQTVSSQKNKPTSPSVRGARSSGFTSRYEQSLDNLINSTNYPRRGHVFSSAGNRYFEADGRTFVQDKETGTYNEAINGQIDRSIKYHHFTHGDRRIMDYLLPEDSVPFPRSIPQDMNAVSGAKGVENPLGTLKLPADGTTIVIPEEYRAPGEDGKVVLNIGSGRSGNRGITQFDNEKYGPGDSAYLFWNHGTAPDMLKDAGITVIPKYYTDGRKMRYLEFQFTKPGVFEIGGKRYEVSSDGNVKELK